MSEILEVEKQVMLLHLENLKLKYEIEKLKKLINKLVGETNGL